MSVPESTTTDLDSIGDGQHARATDRPATLAALTETVAARVAEGEAIYPRGGGTALDYGNPPARPGVAVDVRGLNRVIDYPAADMTVTVEAGITLAALRAVLAAEGQRLWVDAPEADRATLGGIFATDTSGPRRFGQGRPRDQILGVRFVTSAGVVVQGGGRVVKNVAGYDLPKLLTGSLGTLGIIAELTLKVRPAPESAALAWATFPDTDAAARALDALNTSRTRPVALEMLNAAAARAIAGAPVTENGWTLAALFEDNRASVAWQVDQIGDELRTGHPQIMRDAEVDPVLAALVESQAGGPGLVQFKATVRPSHLAEFLEPVVAGRWRVQSHAGTGIARGWLDPAVTAESEAAAEVDAVRATAERLGGALTLPVCPTGWKPRLKVWGNPRPDWALSHRVKTALDPANAMNPGRFLPEH